MHHNFLECDGKMVEGIREKMSHVYIDFTDGSVLHLYVQVTGLPKLEFTGGENLSVKEALRVADKTRRTTVGGDLLESAIQVLAKAVHSFEEANKGGKDNDI